MNDYLINMAIVGLVMVLFRKTLYKFRQRFFASVMSSTANVCNRLTYHIKEKHFTPMKNTVSADPEMRSKKQFRLLEIGAGSGANLQHYPAGSRLILLDLNAEFEDKLRARLAQFPALQLERLVHTPAEDMSTVPSGSVDVVTSTSVLCSVTDVPQVLSEVKRILAPGGKFYFIEHVIDKKWSMRFFVQHFMTTFRIWPSLFCGCHLSRNIGQMIKDAGFSTVQMQPYYVEGKTLFEQLLFYWVKSQIFGVASK